MVRVDGYRAFTGVMRITPDKPGLEPFEMSGDWLYKPETDCWYVQPEWGFSQSFPAGICAVEMEAT